MGNEESKHKLMETMMKDDPQSMLKAMLFGLELKSFDKEIEKINDFMELDKVDLVRLLTRLIGILHSSK